VIHWWYLQTRVDSETIASHLLGARCRPRELKTDTFVDLPGTTCLQCDLAQKRADPKKGFVHGWNGFKDVHIHVHPHNQLLQRVSARVGWSNRQPLYILDYVTHTW
jgi:hypothetical protein